MAGRMDYFEPDRSSTPAAPASSRSRRVSWLDVAAFGAAVGLLLEVGIDVIEERVLGLARRLAEGLAERGYEIVEPWPRERRESLRHRLLQPSRARPRSRCCAT